MSRLPPESDMEVGTFGMFIKKDSGAVILNVFGTNVVGVPFAAEGRKQVAQINFDVSSLILRTQFKPL